MLLLLSEIAQDPAVSSLAADATSVSFTWLFVKVVLAMVIVCFAAVGILKYLVPKTNFSKNAQGSQIEILERFALEPKKNLYILKIANQKIAVGTTENSIHPLLQIHNEEKNDA